ncbi:uncharacterized protein BDZ99DRAFT_512448 [Mytilinidion resinicola]|uniref:Uncharacterized protein n=1 Tax=Mytilinidion resinicola TaxID=574789 RepID=A0A6A6Y1K1_9PEZI|nr:uncharacterized protein BDZ99DRAFT_512448 [Mytilinidion resinicola]KAF2802652.1 hypothetical protein BDZ99DRAFT_512448 [Mytilinidion resinicola]
MQAWPALADLLARCIDALEQLAADNLNFLAACRVAFAGFLRLSEFTYKKKDLINKRTFINTRLTRSNVCIAADYAMLRLSRSKTNIAHKGVQILLSRISDNACPVRALKRLLSRSPFNRTIFLRRLLLQLTQLGVNLEGYLGYSALNSQVQTLGRWTSDAFRLYFTTNPTILLRLNHQFLTGTPLPYTTPF